MLHVWMRKLIYRILCKFQVLIDCEKNLKSRRENSMIVTNILADLRERRRSKLLAPLK